MWYNFSAQLPVASNLATWFSFVLLSYLTSSFALPDQGISVLVKKTSSPNEMLSESSCGSQCPLWRDTAGF
ncbi:hypothetical protein BJY52DRAFT_1253483 [Lactarius psammicola]|nr:hypothetical protein BJY52DRAFT_1253483 [Lactarius psammicola]